MSLSPKSPYFSISFPALLDMTSQDGRTCILTRGGRVTLHWLSSILHRRVVLLTYIVCLSGSRLGGQQQAQAITSLGRSTRSIFGKLKRHWKMIREAGCQRPGTRGRGVKPRNEDENKNHEPIRRLCSAAGQFCSLVLAPSLDIRPGLGRGWRS